MPILFNQKEDSVQLAVWQITEEEPYFLDRLGLTPSSIAHLKGKRRLEWLASRMLLVDVLPDDLNSTLLKDDFGKPYLQDHAHIQVSLSHTTGYAALAISAQPVGVDIQRPVDKITRIAHKFLNSTELAYHDPMTVEQLHVYWGAKETLYKIYGRGRVEFRRHLALSPLDLETKTILGRIEMPDHQTTVMCRYAITHDFILVYGYEEALLAPPQIPVS
ncbi:MAG: 4'-phosphopantetheinyl transferase superfamily protein [Saprospiraceae bacterium]|nr:4'-phosphopantetheinyl transferase superfamily protein [Saprospiraceae bacterium]